MKKIIFILLFATVIVTVAWSFLSAPKSLNKTTVSIADSIAKYKLDQQKVRIIIRKSDYKLDLYIDSRLVKSYPVVFGPDPVNDKTHEGDGCTPEGIYKIKQKYPHRSWSYFLWIDYPNEAAWKRFNDNKKKGLIAKDATIGGDVGIHGVPFVTTSFGNHQSADTPHAEDLIDKKTNWTLGCISLKTNDITELYKYVPAGTEVEILH